jgi:hypothetical protein
VAYVVRERSSNKRPNDRREAKHAAEYAHVHRPILEARGLQHNLHHRGEHSCCPEPAHYPPCDDGINVLRDPADEGAGLEYENGSDENPFGGKDAQDWAERQEENTGLCGSVTFR